MLAESIRLEMYKQRSTLFAILAILGISLVGAFSQYFFNPDRVMDSLKTLSVVAVFCIPLIACIFAGVGSAGLRNEQRRMAEEMLPIHPRNRVIGAYLVSLFSFAFVSGILLLACFAAGEWSYLQSAESENWIPIAILTVIYLHFIAFLFTYWTAQPVLGTGLVFVVTGMTAVCARNLYWLYNWPYRDLSWETLLRFALLMLLLFSAVASILLWLLPARIERRRPLRLRGILVGMALLLAPMTAFTVLLMRAHSLETTLRPAETWYWVLPIPRLFNADAPGGAVFKTESGTYVRIHVDGSRELFAQGESVRLFERAPFLRQILNATFDSSGQYWELSRPDIRDWNMYEVRRARRGGKLEPYATFRSSEVEPEILLSVQNGIGICGYGKDFSCGAVLPGAKPVRWQTIPSAAGKHLIGAANEFAASESGTAAVLSDDGLKLTFHPQSGEPVTWQLPASALSYSKYVLPIYMQQDKPVFALMLKAPGQRIVLCLPDGSLRDPWNRFWSDDLMLARAVPGGFVWATSAWKQRKSMLVLTDRGTSFSPVDLTQLGKMTAGTLLLPLRIKDSHLWVIVKNRFIEFDLQNGKMVRDLKLAENNEEEAIWNRINLSPSQDGLYVIQNDRIQLIRWDFSQIDLGAATL